MRRDPSRGRDYNRSTNRRAQQSHRSERLSEPTHDDGPPPLEELTWDEMASIAASAGSRSQEPPRRVWDAEQHFLFIYEGRPVRTDTQ